MSKHRWRDIGGGKIKCDNTGRVMSLRDARSVPDDTHTITLTDAEWAKLQELAAHRGKTPQQCVSGMIAACVTKTTWEHPTTTAAKHNATTHTDPKTPTPKEARHG